MDGKPQAPSIAPSHLFSTSHLPVPSRYPPHFDHRTEAETKGGRISLRLVNLFMGPDAFQENRFCSFVLHEAEHDAAVITRTARQRSLQFAFQLVSF